VSISPAASPRDPADAHAAIGRVRHDLLTPLNAVSGFLAIVGEDVAAMGRADLAARVRELRADAAGIIAAIQALAQPGEGVDADAVAAALRARCEAPARGIARGVAEIGAAAAGGPATLPGDLRQVENGTAALLAMLEELPARLRAALAAV
jgi:signal transduction histidine kinase